MQNSIENHVKKTGILRACQFGSLHDVKRQIEMGCDVNEQDNLGIPAIIIAARGNYSAIVEILAQHGADIKAETSEGESVAFWANEHENLEMIKLVNEASTQLNNSFRRSP
jgi:ankyrin repeat protein